MTKDKPRPIAGTDAPGALTVLRPVDARRRMTKEYAIASNGQVGRADYSLAKTFRAETRAVDDIAGLHRALVEIEGDPQAFIIRGAPAEGADLNHARRVKAENGGAWLDVPRAWIMLDADKIPLPPGASVLDDPADVAAHLVELFGSLAPDLEGATCAVQFSSSAGISEMAAAEAAAGLPPRWGKLASGDTVSAHLWYWLDVPQDGDALDRWAGAVNARAGNRVIDPATLRTVQPNYTAAPVFGPGLRDPLAGRRTILVHGVADAVTLDIPPPPKPGERPSGDASAFAGMGFAGRLAAIGDPMHGFHAPILSAIAFYVADNWPAPDVEALVALLQDRIRSADPGGRSKAEIDRYADADNLKARIAWTVARHGAKATAEAEARAQAEAVPPTFPDRGVPLAEAQRLAAEAVADFAARLRAGERPRTLLRLTVGGGKSDAAVKGAVRLIEAAREGDGGPDSEAGALFFLVPRHALGDEIVQRLQAAHPGRAVAVWRGMDADDPAAPGEKMCRDPELPKAAAAAGLSQTEVCGACPLRDACGHRRQRAQRADIWIAAHNMLFHPKPEALPPAALIVIDEAFWQAGLRGMDGPPVQLALSALDDTRTGTLDRASAERLRHLRHKAATALRAQIGADAIAGRPQSEPAEVRRAPLEAEGFTAALAEEWGKLEWMTQPKADLAAGMDRRAILDRLRDAQASGFTMLRPLLAKLLRALLDGDAHSSVNVTAAPEADLGRNQGSGPAVQFAWRADFAKWAATAPKLYLDGTTHPDVLRVWEPDLAVVDIEVTAPHQHVRQACDREFGRASFDGPARDEAETDAEAAPSRVKQLADLVAVELAEAGAGDVLVIAQAKVEAALAVELGRRFGGGLPPRLHMAHHGNLTGLDRWRGVARLVVVGRPALNRLDGERRAAVLRGGAVATVQDGDRSRWPTTQGGIRRANGLGYGIAQPCHPDALVEAVRWSISEGAVIQAIGRARAVQRTTPVHVTLLCRLALPLTVETVATWGEVQPDRLTTAAAEAALRGTAMPFAPADMATARPDLWETEAAARKDKGRCLAAKVGHRLIDTTHKGLSHFTGQATARYRREATARRWSMALVPVEGGRAALERALGLVAAFEWAQAPGADAEAEAPAASAAPPPPPPGPVPPPAEAPAPEAAPEAPAPAPTRPAGAVLFVMGEDPPWHDPARPAPPSPPPRPTSAQRATLAHLAGRLDAVKPPRPWGDFTDEIRAEAWRARCAASRARHHANDVAGDATAAGLA